MKNALAEEKRKQKQNKPLSTAETNVDKKKQTKAAKKSRKQLVHDDENEEDEDCVCIVCLSPFSASKRGEKWIQCTDCKRWAHEECAGVGTSPVYVCHNCDSDGEPIYSRW